METVKLFVWKMGHLQIVGGKKISYWERKKACKNAAVGDHNFIP